MFDLGEKAATIFLFILYTGLIISIRPLTPLDENCGLDKNLRASYLCIFFSRSCNFSVSA